MGRRKVGLHEVAYERLSEAEKRRPHEPLKMTSGNSKDAVRMWICMKAWCENVEYTYTSPHEPPICHGGMRWSFTTNGIVDPRIHHPWVEPF